MKWTAQALGSCVRFLHKEVEASDLGKASLPCSPHRHTYAEAEPAMDCLGRRPDSYFVFLLVMTL